MNLSSTRWTPIGPAPVDTPAKALGHTVGRIDAAAPDPGNVDTMYVGGGGGGVWKTGVWTRTDPSGFPSPTISRAQTSPVITRWPFTLRITEPVFALVSGPGAGVLKSTDFGIGWQLLGNDLFEGASLHSIAVHPKRCQDVLCRGLYRRYFLRCRGIQDDRRRRKVDQHDCERSRRFDQRRNRRQVGPQDSVRRNDSFRCSTMQDV